MKHIRFVLLSCLAMGLTTAHAQNTQGAQSTPAPASAATPATATATPTPASASTSAQDAALDKQLQDLATLRQQSAVLQAQVEAEGLRAELAKAQGKSTGSTTGTDELPQLVGIVSGQGGVSAEFLSGDAIFQAHPGDWVSNKWRLTKVLANGVELTMKGSKATHTLLFGARSPVKGSMSQYAGSQPALSNTP